MIRVRQLLTGGVRCGQTQCKLDLSGVIPSEADVTKAVLEYILVEVTTAKDDGPMSSLGPLLRHVHLCEGGGGTGLSLPHVLIQVDLVIAGRARGMDVRDDHT